MDRYLLVLVGAGIGGLARYIAASAIMHRWAGQFPMGTMLVNLSGSFLVGLIMTLLTERLDVHPNWRLLLVVGFLGGYTTFSSFEYETLQAMRSGNGLIGLGYVLASVVGGYMAVWLGAIIAQR